MKKKFKQTIAVFIALLLPFQGVGIAPVFSQTPFGGAQTSASMVTVSPVFAPAVLRGLKVDPQNPFHFNFVLDNGQSKLAGENLKSEGTKLIKYFLASLTLPENDLWVNLSPYEKDRIITNEFGQTEMGRQLLSEDYLLKKLSASLLHPDAEIGKKFWDKVRKMTAQKFGTTDVTMDTFNRIWIMPDKAVVYQDQGTAFIGETHLKVLLEEDYVALANQRASAESFSPAKDVAVKKNDDSTQIFRDEILPIIEKEVNEGENFASLRQIYHSLILASWYKRTLKQSLLSQVYVDRKKVAGVESDDKDAKQKIYEQYLETFKKGVYNLIREEQDAATGEMIPRKYFSGGVTLLVSSAAIETRPLFEASALTTGKLSILDTNAQGFNEPAASSAVPELLGSDLMEAFAKINGGQAPGIYAAQGSLREIRDQVNVWKSEKKPDDELIVMSLGVTDNPVQNNLLDKKIVQDTRRILVGKRGEIFSNPYYVLIDPSAIRLEQFDVVLDYSIFPEEKLIHMDKFSIGRKSSGQNIESISILRDQGFAQGIIDRLAAEFVRTSAGYSVVSVPIGTANGQVTRALGQLQKKFDLKPVAPESGEWERFKDLGIFDPLMNGKEVYLGQVSTWREPGRSAASSSVTSLEMPLKSSIGEIKVEFNNVIDSFTSEDQDDRAVARSEIEYLQAIVGKLVEHEIMAGAGSEAGKGISVESLAVTNGHRVFLASWGSQRYAVKRSKGELYNKFIKNDWEILNKLNSDPSKRRPDIAKPVLYGEEPLTRVAGDSRPLTAYLVTEYLDGEDLSEAIKPPRGPLNLSQVVNLGISLSETVEYVNEQGIVIRDINPPNIKMLMNGKIALYDFDVSLLPDYDWDKDENEFKYTAMNGWNIEDRDTTPEDRIRPKVQTDVFSIGMTLLRAAIPTFYWAENINIEEALSDVEKVDPELKRIIAKAISPRWTRYKNNSELKADLLARQATLSDTLAASSAGVSRDLGSLLTINIDETLYNGDLRRFLSDAAKNLIAQELTKGVEPNGEQVFVRKMSDFRSKKSDFYLLQWGQKEYILKIANHPLRNHYINRHWEVLEEIHRLGRDLDIVYPILKGRVKGLEFQDSWLEGRDYFIMEYVPGEDLSERILSKGVLTESQGTDFFLRLARIIARLHAKGIIVADLTAGNIRMKTDEVPSLIDFDLSITKDFPEPLDGLIATVKNDIAMLGARLFFALQAQDPGIEGLKREDVLAAVKNEDIREIIAKAVGKDDQGYKNINELIADLEKVHKKLSVAASSSVNTVLQYSSGEMKVEFKGVTGYFTTKDQADRAIIQMEIPYLQAILTRLVEKEIISGVSAESGTQITVENLSANIANRLFLVNLGGKKFVIKSAQGNQYNDQLKTEEAILQRLNSEPDQPRPDIARVVLSGEEPLEIVRGMNPARAYMVTEYIEGEDLARVLEKRWNLKVEDVVNLGIQLADSVGYVHDKGIMIRDVRPHNIRMKKDGTIALFDFNVSLTPEYDWAQDPDKLRYSLRYNWEVEDRGAHPPLRLRPDVMTDIFSIGMTLLQARVHMIGVATEAQVRWMFGDVENAQLEEIIAKAVGPREKRYKNTAELKADLVALAQSISEEKVAASSAVKQMPLDERVVARLIPDNVMNVFREINNGKDPFVYISADTRSRTQMTLSHWTRQNQGPDDFIVMALRVDPDGGELKDDKNANRYDYKLWAGPRKEVFNLADAFLKYRAKTSLEGLDFVREFSVFPDKQLVYLDKTSLGRNPKDAKNTIPLLRSKGFMPELYKNLRGELSRYYPGFDVVTVPNLQSAVPGLMAENYSAKQLPLEDPKWQKVLPLNIVFEHEFKDVLWGKISPPDSASSAVLEPKIVANDALSYDAAQHALINSSNGQVLQNINNVGNNTDVFDVGAGNIIRIPRPSWFFPPEKIALIIASGEAGISPRVRSVGKTKNGVLYFEVEKINGISLGTQLKQQGRTTFNDQELDLISDLLILQIKSGVRIPQTFNFNDVFLVSDPTRPRAVVIDPDSIVKWTGSFNDLVKAYLDLQLGLGWTQVDPNAKIRKRLEAFAASSGVGLPENKDVGGIDLREENLNLDLRGQAGTFMMPADPSEVQNIHIDGLVPVILNVTPLPSLPAFLQLSEVQTAEPAQLSLQK